MLKKCLNRETLTSDRTKMRENVHLIQMKTLAPVVRLNR